MEKLFLSTAVLLTLLFSACTDFPHRYESIEGDKIRPLTILFNPAEASPGDTVSVRLVAVFPDSGNKPTVSWTVSLDYGIDLYGNEIIERNIVPLDRFMVPGTDTGGVAFRFVVPDSTLLYSTTLKSLVPALDSNLTPYTADAFCRYLAASQIPVSDSVYHLIDRFAAPIRLRARMVQGIDLTVTRQFFVRWSSRLNSPDVNTNPFINWVKFIDVNAKNITNPDSIPFKPHTTEYLLNDTTPSLESDTFFIEKDHSYFFASDSSGFQTYDYFSLIDTMFKTDKEQLSYDWLYTNLDFNSSMKQDSLLLMPGGRDGPVCAFLPPVDTRMKNFKIYVVVRDVRWNNLTVPNGSAFRTVQGVFKYSDAYIKAHQ